MPDGDEFDDLVMRISDAHSEARRHGQRFVCFLLEMALIEVARLREKAQGDAAAMAA